MHARDRGSARAHPASADRYRAVARRIAARLRLGHCRAILSPFLFMKRSSPALPHSALLELKRWNTPTIYNGWEQITRHNFAADAFNLEETRDFMPHMGPMVGYAVTVVCEPSNGEHPKTNPNRWSEYRQYVASLPG